MPQNLDLKQLERKAFRSTFQDGLWDIYLGLLLLLLWAGPLFLDPIEPSWLRLAARVGVMAAAVLAFVAGKRFITLPRLGSAKFGPTRKAKRRKTAAVYAAAVAAGLLLWILAVAAQRDPTGLGAVFRSSHTWVGLSIALMAGLVIGAGAHFLDFTRGYLHAVLYAAAFAAAEVLDTPLGFAIGGGIGLVVGIVCLVRFLRDYPIPEEVSHGTES